MTIHSKLKPHGNTELVPQIVDRAGGMESTVPHLRLYGTSLCLKHDHMN